MCSRILTWSLALALAFSMSAAGCREDGPGERLGKALDDAAADIRHAAEEEMEAALEAAEDAADEASERIRDEADAAREKAHEAIDEVAGPERS